LTLTRTCAAVLLAAFAGAAAVVLVTQTQIHAQAQNPAAPTPAQIPTPSRPQPPAAPTTNRSLIFLDPAHGGADSGATLGDHILEKDVTLAFATRLRSALTSAGFTVVTTRDADPSDPLTPDQRAETANRSHAAACIVLHATAVGSGVHVYTSTLEPALPEDADSSSAYVPVPWETAQASFVDQSRSLADILKTALAKASLPALTGQAPLRPLDNLMCPAVAVEIAPNAGTAAPANDSDYQQHIAFALTTALQKWRDQLAPAPASPASPVGPPQ